MGAHAFNPNTFEEEAGGPLSSRPAWSTKFLSPRTARATQRSNVSRNQKRGKKEKKKKIKVKKK